MELSHIHKAVKYKKKTFLFSRFIQIKHNLRKNTCENIYVCITGRVHYYVIDHERVWSEELD